MSTPIEYPVPIEEDEDPTIPPTVCGYGNPHYIQEKRTGEDGEVVHTIYCPDEWNIMDMHHDTTLLRPCNYNTTSIRPSVENPFQFHIKYNPHRQVTELLWNVEYIDEWLRSMEETVTTYTDDQWAKTNYSAEDFLSTPVEIDHMTYASTLDVRTALHAVLGRWLMEFRLERDCEQMADDTASAGMIDLHIPRMIERFTDCMYVASNMIEKHLQDNPFTQVV